MLNTILPKQLQIKVAVWTQRQVKKCAYFKFDIIVSGDFYFWLYTVNSAAIDQENPPVYRNWPAETHCVYYTYYILTRLRNNTRHCSSQDAGYLVEGTDNYITNRWFSMPNEFQIARIYFLECGVSKKTTLKLIIAFVDVDSYDCPTTWKQLLEQAGSF